MKGKVREYLNKSLREMGYNIPEKEDMSVLNLGLSSFYLMKLIVEIENEFDITFDFEDMDFSNFNTLDKISDIVARYVEDCVK